VQDRHIVTMVG